MKNAIEPPVRGDRLQTKLEDWPPIDQSLWAQAVEAGDILSAAGAAAKWASGTRKTVIKSYGRWLNWLQSAGLLNPAQSPATRAKPDMVAAFAGHLHDNQAASTTTWSYVYGLCMALMVMEPLADIEPLWEIERRLSRRKASIRRKAQRVVPVSKLYRLGFELMADAASCGHPGSLKVARRFRDGSMVALLAARPIRIRNLRSIVIGKNLIRANGIFYLIFAPDETKTHNALEFHLPTQLSTRMVIYLQTYRPILAARTRPRTMGEHCAAGDALWVSQFGTAMTDFSIYTAIADATCKRFGHSINPHLFRDCAATSIALEDAAHVQITTSILGHACLSTSERYYNHALAVRAVNLHQAEILSARKAFAKSVKRERAEKTRAGTTDKKPTDETGLT
jgi:hypothetical protein